MSHEFHDLVAGSRVALQGVQGRYPDHRCVVARELVLVEQLTDLHLDQLEQFLVVDHVALVEGNDDLGHTHLAGQQHVLTCLGHWAIGG